MKRMSRHQPARDLSGAPDVAEARPGLVSLRPFWAAAAALVQMSAADRLMTISGFALALGSSAFAVTMIARNADAPPGVMRHYADAYGPLYWKKPIEIAAPELSPDALSAALLSKARNIDMTPLGSIAERTEPETSLPGYSVVAASHESAVLEGPDGFVQVRAGAQLAPGCVVQQIEQENGVWVVRTSQGVISGGGS